jgi:hypothetical protein
MGGQQKNFISDIVFFQHQDGMRKKVRRHFLQCRAWQRFLAILSLVLCYAVHLGSTENITKDLQRQYDMNVIFQMQGDENWIFPK